MIVRRWTGSSTGLLEKRVSRWDTDVGPSVLVPVLEISLIVPEKRVWRCLSISLTYEYEMVEFEDETNATTWEDYLILPDSPNSTLPGFGIIISPIVLSDDDDDQIITSDPMVSSMALSFTYLTILDSLVTSFWWEYDAIRRGDTPTTKTEVPVIPAPIQWEPYCYTCGEMGHHYLRMCRFYRPY
ncbi:hypothetical protein ARALYDRAFT_359121 [Arabidopsis lyrata subsp. lyrata]|uniref:Uncharacterized protein n=1 Tax=Arabidopsis lyrata subsp. lyrata TaxID=81972 RepID=D7MVP4_ARALL|nr:hypothetical protein ARALYDRAFT_359121 [Arabidopsis lyrata subsp. lyrata]